MPDPVPLCVDLDGTLIRSDLLHESFAGAVRHDLSVAFKAPLWLMSGGKSRLKHELARRAHLDIATLPYRTELVQWLRTERAAGRRIVLATAATRQLAEAVAERLGVFDHILCTDNGHNLKGPHKLAKIQSDIGSDFDYIGDCDADRPILTAARKGYLIGPGACTVSGGETAPFHVPPASRAKGLIKLLRPQQWTKNALVLVSVLFAHQIDQPAKVVASLLALVAFCLVASSVYVLNDFLDVQADRLHHRKKHRPLASGTVPILWAPAILGLLLLLACVICLFLPWQFAAVLGLYALISAAYSFYLKTRMLFDVMVLAGLYTIRIIAGGAATGIATSEWLFAFSMFLFSSLAFAKRFTEIRQACRDGDEKLARRGYIGADLPILLAAGVGSGMVSVLVLALYINATPSGLYRSPQLLWLVCPLILYWITRVWFLANRGQLHDDPVVFAITDRISWLCALLCGCVLVAASVVAR
jgi:4-hydroxybenzoate polyprenyltransferase/phosphoserine phosphatase